MPAMMERHLKDGKPAPSNIPARETISCPVLGCEFSYTLFYTEEENALNGSEINVVDMRRLAAAFIDQAHPVHCTRKHVWKDGEGGWVEEDAMAARNAR